MKTNLFRALAVSALTLAFTASGGVAAHADKGGTAKRIEIPKDAQLVSYLVIDATGKPRRDVPIRVETTSAKKHAVIDDIGIQLACVGYNAPAPTYSWSNHTMHFGMNANCDRPVSVKARTSLWSGPRPDSANIFQAETGWDYGVGSVHTGDVRTCVDWGGFAWWELLLYAEAYDGGWWRFSPYPGRSLKENECLDIA